MVILFHLIILKEIGQGLTKHWYLVQFVPCLLTSDIRLYCMVLSCWNVSFQKLLVV
jgi:hypothetical protein